MLTRDPEQSCEQTWWQFGDQEAAEVKTFEISRRTVALLLDAAGIRIDIFNIEAKLD